MNKKIKEYLSSVLIDFLFLRFRKPETRKLLTQEEYEQQGVDFTRQELEKLRLSLLDDCRCKSPNESLTRQIKNSDR